MFGTDRTAMRRFWLAAWRKYREKRPLEPLEAQIAEAVAQHPEYHRLFASEAALEREWSPEAGESNPFLHLSMHMALREQIGTDRPAGIAALYPRICARYDDAHDAEHAMAECLATLIWETQHNGTPPDEAAYLECLRRLS